MTLVTDASVGRVCSCHHARPKITRNSFLLSKNVCWCRLRMPLLAESVPATMLDPKALGTAFQKTKNKRPEWNCTSSPSLNNAADYKGGGVASPQASWIFGTARIMRARHGNIWHGTDHEGMARKYLARHGSTRSWHGTARDVPGLVSSLQYASTKDNLSQQLLYNVFACFLPEYERAPKSIILSYFSSGWELEKSQRIRNQMHEKHLQSAT